MTMEGLTMSVSCQYPVTGVHIESAWKRSLCPVHGKLLPDMAPARVGESECGAAVSRTTPARELAVLALAPELAHLVAANPSAAPETLVGLCEMRLSARALYDDRAAAVVTAVAGNPATPAPLLRRIMQTNNGPWIRAAAANPSALDSDLIQGMTGGSPRAPQIANGVLENPSAEIATKEFARKVLEPS